MQKTNFFWLSLLPAFFILIFMALSSVAQGYYYPPDTSGAVTGVTAANTEAAVIAGEFYRIDFEKANWTLASVSSPVYANRSYGVSIDPAKILKIDMDGEVDGNQRYAYFVNRRWIDFGWCTDWETNPKSTCASRRLRVDLGLKGPLAVSTGDAYWSGLAYWSKTQNKDVVEEGWLNFDWTCDNVKGECDIKNRVHTDLDTEEVSGFAYLNKIGSDGKAYGVGWVDFGNRDQKQYTVYEDLMEIAEDPGCTGFEKLNVGDEYHVGDTFTTPDFKVEAVGYDSGSGSGLTTTGTAKVEDGGKAGGIGKEMNLSNIGLSFDFGTTVRDVSLNYGDYGGNVNVKINGEAQVFADFKDIDEHEIGGVTVSVTTNQKTSTGSVTFTGVVEDFAVGGSEFWLDDVCYDEEVETIFVQPVVTLTPNPAGIGKYDSVLADGDDAYVLAVELLTVGSDGSISSLDDTYTVDITVNPTADSHVYMNQIDQTMSSADTVSFDPVSYDSSDSKFKVKIKSWAPTSNVNGYMNESGTMVYPFDHEVGDPTNRSTDINKYEFESIDIDVTGPNLVSLTTFSGYDDLVYPLWGLSSDEVNLKFAPAIDITNLGRTEDGAIYYNLPSDPNEVIEMKGIIAVWSDSLKSKIDAFKVVANLYSASLNYIFDSDGDGDYVPAPGGSDGTQMTSSYTMSSMISGTGLIAEFEDTGYYVPIDEYDMSTQLGGGSVGGQIKVTMLVNDSGYMAAAGLHKSHESFLARAFNLLSQNAFAAVVGQLSLPNLQITSLSYDPSAGEITLVAENTGSGSCQSTIDAEPYISVTGAGTTIETITVANNNYSVAGGSDTFVIPYVAAMEQTITATIDSTSKCGESNEQDNSESVHVTADQVLGIGDLNFVNLEVTNFTRDDVSGELKVTVENTGNSSADPSGYSGDPKLFVDKIGGGTRQHIKTFNYTGGDNQDFLHAGGSSNFVFTYPSPEPSSYTLEACIDPNDWVDELYEDDNCMELSVELQSGQPDLVISNMYLNDENQVVLVQSNEGTSDVSPNAYETTSLWIDGDLQTDFYWQSMNNDFRAIGGSTSVDTGVTVTGDHLVQACVDSYNNVDELNDKNNCMSITVGDGYDAEPLYETVVKYTVYPVLGTSAEVAYYSHYMPLLSGNAVSYNVPAFETKLDAEISGSVTSFESFDDSDIENIGGEFDLSALRNELYERFKTVSKGVDCAEGGEISGAMVGGTEVMNGDVLCFSGGDVTISALEDDYPEKMIVIEDGNLFIDTNFSGQSSTGIAVFNGDVYIRNDVTDIVGVNLFAEGGVHSYLGDPSQLLREDYAGNKYKLMDWTYDSRQEALTNQLTWVGSIVANVTVNGGNVSDTGAYTYPDGSTVTGTVDSEAVMMAIDSSLSHLRTFVTCWVQTDEYGNPVDQDEPDESGHLADGADGYNYDGSIDYDDMEECDGFARSEYYDFDPSTDDLFDANNSPFNLIYQPAPSTMPIMSRIS